MKSKTLYIENPSPKLLELFRKLREEHQNWAKQIKEKYGTEKTS